MTFEEWFETKRESIEYTGVAKYIDHVEKWAKQAWDEAYRIGHERGVSDALGTFPNGIPEDMKDD